MGKKGRWKKNFVTALEIPGDLAYRDTILTVTGSDQVMIENYRSILRYTRETIVVRTSGGTVAISGKRLEIPFYTAFEMQISGQITSISMER